MNFFSFFLIQQERNHDVHNTLIYSVGCYGDEIIVAALMVYLCTWHALELFSKTDLFLRLIHSDVGCASPVRVCMRVCVCVHACVCVCISLYVCVCHVGFAYFWPFFATHLRRRSI